jgi:hypothetical protein
MLKKISLILFSTLLLLTACHKKAMVQSNDAAADGLDKVIVDAKADMTATGNLYHIDSIRIQGNVLSAFVNYSGGCKEHSFELISNGIYDKSNPPQIALCLKHKSNEDMCRKLIMRELKFNISSIKIKGKKSLVVNLGSEHVTYTY